MTFYSKIRNIFDTIKCSSLLQSLSVASSSSSLTTYDLTVIYFVQHYCIIDKIILQFLVGIVTHGPQFDAPTY